MHVQNIITVKMVEKVLAVSFDPFQDAAVNPRGTAAKTTLRRLTGNGIASQPLAMITSDPMNSVTFRHDCRRS
jgi:hypothetical protein